MNPQVQRENRIVILKYLGVIDNKNTKYQNLWDLTRTELRKKF